MEGGPENEISKLTITIINNFLTFELRVLHCVPRLGDARTHRYTHEVGHQEVARLVRQHLFFERE
jgi:hypothetical protein